MPSGWKQPCAVKRPMVHTRSAAVSASRNRLTAARQPARNQRQTHSGEHVQGQTRLCDSLPPPAQTRRQSSVAGWYPITRGSRRPGSYTLARSFVRYGIADCEIAHAGQITFFFSEASALQGLRPSSRSQVESLMVENELWLFLGVRRRSSLLVVDEKYC